MNESFLHFNLEQFNNYSQNGIIYQKTLLQKVAFQGRVLS